MYAQKQKNREDSRENTSRQMKSWKNIDFIRMPSDLSASNSFDSSSRLSCNPPTKFGQGKAHKDGKLKDLRLPFISREGSKQ